MCFHRHKCHSIMAGSLDAGSIFKLVLAGVVVLGSVKLVRKILSD